MAIKRGSKVESSSSSASMTDMIFLLLIFFMVATTLISPNAVKVILPKNNSVVKEQPYTTVTVTKDLNYFVDGNPVQFNNLENALREKMEGAEKPIFSLHADQDVPWGEINKIMKIATKNNYTLIAATAPE